MASSMAQTNGFPSTVNGQPPCWLDALDYGERTVRNGRGLPWLQVSEFVDLQNKLDRLVGSDVVALPLGRLAQAYVESSDDVRQAMGARSRLGYALRVLLAEADFADTATKLLSALESTFGARRTLAVTVPSPAAWTGWANAIANGAAEAPEVAPEVAEDSAVRVADFLRGFSANRLGAVLVVDTAPSQPANGDAAACEPIANVAHYYGASFGIETDAPCADAQFVDFTIGDSATAGVRIPGAFWAGGPAPVPPAGGFLYGHIPPESEPEQVLARIEDLRRTGT